MTLLFVILIIICSFILGLIVLIQNPKGGGLAGSFGGLSTQFMGVKQTTDVLEKGTWIFAGLIGLLCILSSFFIADKAPGSQGDVNSKGADAQLPANKQNAPANPNAVPFNGAQGVQPVAPSTATPDSN